MKHRWIAAVPVFALVIMGVAAPASAAPVVTDVFAALPMDAYPSALTVDAAGSVYTANSGIDTITKLQPDGAVDPAFSATLPPGAFPVQLADDRRGSIFVTGLISSELYKIDATTGAIDGAFATRLGTELDGRHPNGLAVDAKGDVFVVNTADETVVEISGSGVVRAEFHLAAGAESQSAVFDDAGNLYVANSGDDTISRIAFDKSGHGTVETDWALLPTGSRPVAVAVDHQGFAYAVAPGSEAVTKLDLSKPHGLNVLSSISLTGSYPLGISSDERGNVVTSNIGDNSVTLIPVDGTRPQQIAVFAGAPFPQAVAAGKGVVYTANNADSTVSRVVIAPAIVSPPPAGHAQVGVAYTATTTATGLEPVTFGWTGSPPVGLTLDARTGEISGTPVVAGTFEFDIIASNLASRSKPLHATIVVNSADGSTGCWYWREACGL